MLDVSGQVASSSTRINWRGWDYIERLEKTLCEASETRVLVFGAAGMTLGRGAPCALDVNFVDIDPAQHGIAAAARPGNRIFRCRKGPFDSDRAIYSDAVPRADLDRSLR